MPLAYLITFHTRGTWLHGDAPGSVDRDHNTPNTPYIKPSPFLRARAKRHMTDSPVILASAAREQVDSTIIDHCRIREWKLHARHTGATHVHLVVTAPVPPERVMSEIKAWRTRRLRESGLADAESRIWSRHGSTRWIDSSTSLGRAIEYVTHEQTGAFQAWKQVDRNTHERIMARNEEPDANPPPF